MAKRVFLGVGSNLGDSYNNIQKAINLLNEINGVKIVAVAPFYKTAPVGYLDQDWFLNSVIECKTEIPPRELLYALLDIENKMGRVRTIRWGPRVVDLDLLIYENERINEPDLIVPHPRMTERAFVIVPLADLAPDLKMPGGQTATSLAEQLKKEQQIEEVLSPL
ncbi:2-amino-4-hydroxy-6-hydroxymethyldihydropteridine diphosphokinase [Desulfolucanica intricata]|uniref:2-amino-4-hydroxy-6- hydroxymethyldihydropteridine diphosphokinase n=1 Tax=Desulfolucanica intricata TaxID=1285191 RepID=UPI00082F1519|nr:2-amino-4-hydroxy-6-hydroxymethyldihydropteridine diphosphokinase [Desulfolucanica intricata]